MQATKVRQNFQDVIDEVHYRGEFMIISKYGKPWVMIQPLPETDRDIQKLLGRHPSFQEKKKQLKKVIRKALKEVE